MCRQLSRGSQGRSPPSAERLSARAARPRQSQRRQTESRPSGRCVMTRLVQSQGRRSAYSSGSGLARVAWSDVAQYHLCGLRPPAVLQHSSGTKRRPRFKQSLWAQGQTVWVDAPGESVQGHFSLLQCAGALTKTSALLTCTE